MIGSTTVEQFDEEEANLFLQHDRRAFETGYSEVEETITDANGDTHIFLTKKVRFSDLDGEEYILGVSRDITKIKQSELEIINSNEELKRSNHALERFAYIASHDLQEPLRKIGGFTERLNSSLGEKLEEKEKVYMNFVLDGVERMRDLIQGLLAYSRVTTDEIDIQKLDSKAIVETAADNLSELIKETDAKINIGDLPEVYYDRVMFTQMFQNLIGNAIKYKGEDAPVIDIAAEKKDLYWEFSVSDNGMGMDEKHLDRIFEMFQRLHRKEDIAGTGIGLSLCRKIAERYGGNIRVTSEVGKGSTFYFTVPMKVVDRVG